MEVCFKNIRDLWEVKLKIAQHMPLILHFTKMETQGCRQGSEERYGSAPRLPTGPRVAHNLASLLLSCKCGHGEAFLCSL